jgi:hypothetical protein
MIPKFLHYVWVGGPMPDTQRRYLDTWHESNPDFQIICWNEQNIDMSQPIIRDAYKRKKWAKVADIARLQAVLRSGGIYLDTDFKIVKSLAPLLHHKCFYAFQTQESGSDWIGNGAFGAEPGHWFIREALDGLYAMRPSLLLERPTVFGPKHITRLLRAHGLGGGYEPQGVLVKDVYVAPVPVFYPFGYAETFTPACITEDTLAVHFWEGSWKGTVPLPVRAAKRILRWRRPTYA